MSNIQIIHGDCMEVMMTIETKSVDMILCDLPYGTTACKWDTVLPFETLWYHYKRLIKDNGVTVLFGSELFSSALRMSNIREYKYDLIWNKKFASNFAQAKKRPMNIQENICVFYEKQPTYNPQMIQRENPIKATTGSTFSKVSMTKNFDSIINKVYTKKYPESILLFPRILGTSSEKTEHPTQKPVALFEYLIRTYTNKGDMVLDNCSGSGTTGIASFNTNRNAILIEKDANYYQISLDRFNRHKQQTVMDFNCGVVA